MRNLSTILVALALVGTSGLALAQNQLPAGRLDGPLSFGWVGDEPNVAAGGSVPAAWDDSPSRAYPADANGLGSARANSPAPVLAVSWMHRVTPQGPSGDVRGLTSQLTNGGQFIVPGFGQFWAFHGVFHDVNADGWIQDHGNNYDRVHASTDGSCTTSVSTSDGDGLGRPQGANTGVSARCSAADEWVPLNSVIAAYLTPGNPTDVVNRGFGFWNPLTPPGDAAQEEPDFVFQGQAVENQQTGRYFAPTTNFDYVMIDNSLVETQVIEAISDAVTVSLPAERSMEASASSLVEVDVYRSVDPTVETLYLAAISPLTNAGCEPEYMERGCRATTDPVTEPLRQTFDATSGPLVGGTVTQVVTKWEQDPQGLGSARSSPHLFMDLFVDTSLAVTAVASFNDNNIVAGSSEYNNAELSPTADGSTHMWPHVTIMGYFGVWTDLNGDGWIGDPAPAPGCPDEYDCGNDPTPHDFPQNGKDAKGEFTVACGDKAAGVGGAQVQGSFVTTLSPSGGQWGTLGVYVLTDRFDVRNGGDPLVQDGRAPFIPYDDMARDASDGDVDQLVTTGDISVHMICRDGSGFYYSFERLYFLDGTNRDYAVTLSGTTGGDFSAQGVPNDEDVTDVDVIAAAGI